MTAQSAGRRGTALSLVAASFIAAALVALVSLLLVRATGRAANTLLPSPDANIGLGLLMLAAGAGVTALGVWLALRRLRVRAAGGIAAGTVVVYGGTLFVPVVDPASAGSLAIQVAAVAAYTAAAVWLAGRQAPST